MGEVILWLTDGGTQEKPSPGGWPVFVVAVGDTNILFSIAPKPKGTLCCQKT